MAVASTGCQSRVGRTAGVDGEALGVLRDREANLRLVTLKRVAKGGLRKGELGKIVRSLVGGSSRKGNVNYPNRQFFEGESQGSTQVSRT